jgi:hypothetical protein
MEVAQKPRGAARFRAYELVSGAMLHWILPRLAAYVAVVVAAGILFLAGASVYALMWPKPVVPFDYIRNPAS